MTHSPNTARWTTTFQHSLECRLSMIAERLVNETSTVLSIGMMSRRPRTDGYWCAERDGLATAANGERPVASEMAEWLRDHETRTN
jgi:hypothetical protein